MATFVNVSKRIYVGHLDLSNSDKADFGTITVQSVRFTSFNAGGFEEFKPGLISGEVTVEAFQDFAVDVLDDELGVAALGAQYPVTVAPNVSGTETAGDVCYFTRGIISQYGPIVGAKGDAAKATLTVPYDTVAVRGVVAHPKAARTVTGNGTIMALTGPTSSQRLYAALHVTAFSGLTNAVFTVQSDDAVGFPSSATRLTFATITGTGSEFASVAGYGATETHHRIVYTLTGTGSVTFTIAIGVL